MELSPVERETLIHLLTEGDDIPSNIADNIDRHSRSVSRSAKRLKEKELVEDKGRNVYTLTGRGEKTARSVKKTEETLSKNET